MRLSGLAAPTVSMATSQLATLGLVETVGEGESSGGRPPALLRFNASHGYVAGVDIGGTFLRMVLADLNGRQVAQWTTEMTDEQKSAPGVVCLIQNGLLELIGQVGAHGRILRITAGAPGITDVSRGVVLAAPNLSGWNDVPLKEMLESATGISTTVENDTNLAAIGEFAEGVAVGIDNFIFVALGTGVGSGVFLRGAIHHGANWAAGEIGYLPIPEVSQHAVKRHETGQLERAIGGMGIEARWEQLLRTELPSPGDERLKLRASEIFDLAEAGDLQAVDVLHATAGLLAKALSAVTLLYDPELVVLGGGVGSHPALCRVTQQLLLEHDLAVPALRSSLLGAKAQLHGAVSLALSSVESGLLC